MSALGAGTIDDLLRCMTERRFATGDTLYREGDPGDSMAILVEGTVTVRATRPDGEATEIGLLEPGDLFGELACLDPAPRSATLVALDTTLVFEMSRHAPTALRSASPSAAAVIVGIVIREATRRILLLEERIERELAEPDEAPAPAGTRRSSVPPARTSVAPARPSGFWHLLDLLRGRS